MNTLILIVILVYLFSILVSKIVLNIYKGIIDWYLDIEFGKNELFVKHKDRIMKILPYIPIYNSILSYKFLKGK